MSTEDDLWLFLELQMTGCGFDSDSDDFELDREIYLTCRSVETSVRERKSATPGTSSFADNLSRSRDYVLRQLATYVRRTTDSPPELGSDDHA